MARMRRRWVRALADPGTKLHPGTSERPGRLLRKLVWHAPRVRPASVLCLASVGVCVVAWSAITLAAKTYYIDQSTYPGFVGDCGQKEANDHTSSLQTQLNADGWSGYRYTAYDAYPQDFRESCSTVYGSGGLDQWWGDTKVLSVYAGHAGWDGLAYNYSHGGVCTHYHYSHGRLGSMAGAGAGFGVWIGCSSLKPSMLGTTANVQWLQQIFGFDNTVSVGDNEARNFYNQTTESGKSNARAWLDQMDGGGRHPVVVTYDNTSESLCWSKHNVAKLKYGTYRYPRSGGPSCGNNNPWFIGCWEIR